LFQHRRFCKTRTIEEWLSISDDEIERFGYTDIKEEYIFHISTIKKYVKIFINK
jgi:hypothetical protein